MTQNLPSQMATVSDIEASADVTNTLVIGLTMERQDLYRRIDDRIDTMMSSGFLDEVKALEESGYVMGQGPLSSPGYRELGLFLSGESTLDEAVQRTKFQTHRLVRRQYSWVKQDDARIDWLDAANPNLLPEASAMLDGFLVG